MQYLNLMNRHGEILTDYILTVLIALNMALLLAGLVLLLQYWFMTWRAGRKAPVWKAHMRVIAYRIINGKYDCELELSNGHVVRGAMWSWKDSKTGASVYDDDLLTELERIWTLHINWIKGPITSDWHRIDES